MPNDVRKLRLFALVMPLALLLSLFCQWSESVSSEAKLESQSNSSVPGDSHPEIQQTTRSTPVTASVGFTEADFSRHVKELNAQIRKKLSAHLSHGSHGFSIVVQKPFVVVGDEPQKVVEQRAEDTVKWAVDRLKQDFFAKDPNNILDIWLFKDKASYEKHTRLLFGDAPSTPFGYYSPAHKALIMNIATGGGTLVHEIVHPFMEANFPACPPWLNEGLGSLYEQCGDVDGHIHGFTNWRLPGLQRAIVAQGVPSFKSLTEMDSRASTTTTKELTTRSRVTFVTTCRRTACSGSFIRSFLRARRMTQAGTRPYRKFSLRLTWKRSKLSGRSM